MLTPEQIEAMADESFKDYMDDKNDDYDLAFARAVEAAARAEVEPLVRLLVDGISTLALQKSLDDEQREAFKKARAWLSPQDKESNHA